MSRILPAGWFWLLSGPILNLNVILQGQMLGRDWQLPWIYAVLFPAAAAPAGLPSLSFWPGTQPSGSEESLQVPVWTVKKCLWSAAYIRVFICRGLLLFLLYVKWIHIFFQKCLSWSCVDVGCVALMGICQRRLRSLRRIGWSLRFLLSWVSLEGCVMSQKCRTPLVQKTPGSGLLKCVGTKSHPMFRTPKGELGRGMASLNRF